MHHGRADERPDSGLIPLGEQACADRSGDEHQADQRGGRRAHQQVEVMPGMEEF
jgi:hypothetical protein